MTAPLRRGDPIAFTLGWEAAVCAIGFVVAVLVLSALAGLGIAAWAFGGGWIWPHGLDTIGRTLAGLATGHPGRGLPPAEASRAAGVLSSYVCVASCEAATITVATTAGIAIARRLRNDGMATRRDAEHALGLSELRNARQIIRPDLYGGDARAGSPVEHAPTLTGWLRGRSRR